MEATNVERVQEINYLKSEILVYTRVNEINCINYEILVSIILRLTIILSKLRLTIILSKLSSINNQVMDKNSCIIWPVSTIMHEDYQCRQSQ